MNPIHITDTLRRSMIRYLLTTFDVNRDGREPELYFALREAFDTDGALFNGPYLELTLPYITGVTLNDLKSEGVIINELLKLDCFKHGKPIWPDTPLYVHQEKAIRNLITNQRNSIVSSGTGSGKTECFLIPILNDLLVDPTPGVRAVIIYPLNALVNDQLDRLRILLKGTDITFGRYTGELPQKPPRDQENPPLPNEVICRDQIQKEGIIPQILVTNYAMLEYLLLRPADAPLFNSGAWRFIVLDEAHTHAGTKGVEVGLLIRRLRHRLGLGLEDTRCIATSATLTDDNAIEAAEFAEALFGVPFSDDDVVFGEVKKDVLAIEAVDYYDPEIYLHRKFDELIEAVRKQALSVVDIALLMENVGLIDASELEIAEEFEDDPQGFLWEVLKGNVDIHRLLDFMASSGNPIPVEDAAHELFGDQLPAEDRERALFHLIELGTVARPGKDASPLIPARYHLFARPPQGIWVCLNPSCSGKQHYGHGKWSRLFPMRRESCDICDGAVYPLYVCRTCGQVFIRVTEDGFNIIAEANPLDEGRTVYFSWRRIEENPSLAEQVNEDLSMSVTKVNKFSQTEISLCLNCKKINAFCTCEDGEAKPTTLFRIEEREKSSKGTRSVPVKQLKECPRCRDKAFGDDREIATSISMYSSTPLSILTNELYRMLPEANKEKISRKPGGGRKLLSFYDSRQGAARFAAFLQDAVNTQIYQHIIPEAVRQIEEAKGRMPDLDEVATQSFKLAWEHRIFHNDPLFSDELGRIRRPSAAQRERLKLQFMERTLAELTTGRRRRQSMESLGLVAVRYFEADREPDFQKLASLLGLHREETITLVNYLLDGLRNQKIVVLPEGVHRDSVVFGRNRFNYSVVRSKAQRYEIAWIGQTERQYRRKLIKQVLKDANLPSGEDAQIDVLNNVFDWFLDETDLLRGTGADGYWLAYDRIFLTTKSEWFQCDQCNLMSSRGHGGLICPRPSCTGHYIPVEIESALEENYYRHIFKRDLVPMRVEEHTAQLDSKKGRSYQDKFKSGDINVLSCSTTFEMGIDLGDLQGVVLSNVPPTVANYKQRSGRAGRRTSGTAFILSWASNRPHDQTYFTSPTGIINGHVRIPHLAIQNQFILQRHINAILFSDFMRYRASAGYEDLLTVGPFFDEQHVDEPHYEGLEQWLEFNDKGITHLLKTFVPYIEDGIENVSPWKKQFAIDIRNKGKEHYRDVATYYKNETLGAAERLREEGYSKDLTDTMDHYGKLLDRLNDDYLINFLSDRGILPSYSFPLHTVEMLIHPDKARGLRLQRNLRQAIREYAPGQEIVADKRIWKSVSLVFYRETPKFFHYRICDNCNHLQIGKEAGIPINNQDGPCPVCGELPENRKRQIYRYVEPDGFKSSSDSGMPAGQYIQREPNLMRSALIPIEPEDIQRYGEILEAGYSREGKLLYVNEGNYGLGFKLCQKCGLRVGKKKTKCSGTYRGEPCNGKLKIATLGFQEVTDMLQLSFRSTSSFQVPTQTKRSFWLSLMYALIQGASHALQIERRDISGVLFPKKTSTDKWQQTIVLYDDVPGGAGHVREIRKEIILVVQEALRIVNCVDCAPDSSCYHCLRDFGNQYEHHLLKRGTVAKFLEGLLASLKDSGDSGVSHSIIALNYPRWLMQTIGRAQDHVLFHVDDISLKKPSGETHHWLDLINDLLRRDVNVILRLSQTFELDANNPEKLSVARYLQILIDRGLQLEKVEKVPDWRIVIDPSLAKTSRALEAGDDPFVLNDVIGQNGLKTITNSEVVEEISKKIISLRGRKITSEELSPPPNIRVINVDNSLGGVTEKKLFGDVFDRPVKQMHVNDRYLYDKYRIVKRLGSYVSLASGGGQLQKVSVKTWDAEHYHIRQSTRKAQNQAIEQLKRRFPEVDIEFTRSHHVEHDRYFLLNRDDDTQARILIGKGLDFIKSDGSVDPTFIVIEDPYEK